MAHFSRRLGATTAAAVAGAAAAAAGITVTPWTDTAHAQPVGHPHPHSTSALTSAVLAHDAVAPAAAAGAGSDAAIAPFRPRYVCCAASGAGAAAGAATGAPVGDVHATAVCGTVCGSAPFAPSPAPFATPPQVEEFFRVSSAPKALAAHRAEMDAFVARHVAAGTPIAVVTSGGTAVPLERNTVRFLDNFSTGTRGSCCTEALLRAGYAVIMVRRTGSVQPLRRETAKFVSAMDASLSPDGSTVVLPPAVRRELLAARSVSAAGTLMEVPFVSVSDYLHVLKAASEAVAVAGPAAMTLLAAAVSDFYVPEAAMAEHKIQSRGGASGLQLDLVGVPKTLGVLRHVWAPDAFMVSFKLETDAGILMKKAHGALAAYGMNCVVANLLPTRYTEVHIVDAHSAEVVRRPPSSASDGSGGIEELFIRRLVARHQAHMGRQK